MRREASIKNPESGMLLLEILIVVSIAAVIVALSANFIYLSLRSNKIANEKNVALGLLDEVFEAVRGASTEKWQNLYTLTHATQDYHPIQTSNAWDISSAGAVGTESVAINNVSYTRSFRVYHVCRHASTRDITGLTDSSGASATTCTTSGGVADPSTQKVTATVTWNNAGNSVTASEYFAGRWRNKATNHTTWSEGDDTNIDTSNNELKLCNGC